MARNVSQAVSSRPSGATKAVKNHIVFASSNARDHDVEVARLRREGYVIDAENSDAYATQMIIPDSAHEEYMKKLTFSQQNLQTKTRVDKSDSGVTEEDEMVVDTIDTAEDR